MARHEADVVISADNRDHGKVYHIREMSPIDSEAWFARALKLLGSAGTDIPADIFDQGAMGFAAIGIGAALAGLARAPWPDTKQLMDEMLGCVVSLTMPIPGRAEQTPPIAMLSQIIAQTEEVSTLMQIREAVLSLHVGFSVRDWLLEYRDEAARRLRESGLNTETSPDQLPLSSLPN